MEKITRLTGCALVLTAFGAMAQNDTAPQPPSLAELTGDYVIMNYKEYEGQKLLADMKDMRITPKGASSVVLAGFYMAGSEDVTASYSPSDGTISIPAGTQVLGGESGFEQYLYLWDEEREEIRDTPVQFHFQADGSWSAEGSIVLMSGSAGGSLTPYYFSNGTVIRRSNATTENLSYVGWGSEQEIYMESRPSYVELTGNRVTVYNLLQKDQFGYGCLFAGTYTSDGRVTFTPAVIGQANDYTYKVLAGCEYDEGANKPTEVTGAGTRSEGVVKGTLDLENGILEIEPMAIWTGETNGGYVTIAANRSYYEFVKSVKVTFVPDPSASVSVIPSDSGAETVSVEYYSLSGQRLSATPSPGLVIRRTLDSAGNWRSEKVVIK